MWLIMTGSRPSQVIQNKSAWRAHLLHTHRALAGMRFHYYYDHDYDTWRKRRSEQNSERKYKSIFTHLLSF